MGEQPDPVAKRRRLEAEQRAAFQEDMARIRAAAAVGGSEAPRLDESEIEAGDATLQEGSRQQQPGMGSNMGVHREESDDEEDGNWLKKFTPHHTRVGADYQVTDLPTPKKQQK